VANPPDRAHLEAAVREKYRRLAQNEPGLFTYPTGRAGAEALGYRAEWLDRVPPELLERFAGVGCPFEVRVPRAGECVLDVGCGAGTDAFVAAQLVGATGEVAGLDLSPELLELARSAAHASRRTHLRFHAGSAEALPFADASFDQVLSNGALNLVLDKPRALRELARVLRPGGTLAIADLLVIESVPAHVLADLDAWST